MGKKLIELSNVTKRFHNKIALNNINLQIYENEVYGFSGPNGSGKTLTFKSILGFVKVSQGKVVVNDTIIRKDTLFAKGIGFAMQEYGVLPNKSGSENLKLLTLLSQSDSKKIGTILNYVGLDPNDSKKVKDYSLGMRQRLQLAVALIGNNPILIFDEPTNALDEDGQKFVVNLILDLKSKGKTILVSSHDANFLRKVSDKIFYFSDGQITREVGQ